MNGEAPSITSNKLSDEQEIVAIVLRICSASLSIPGSGILIFKILRDRVRNGCTKAYDRTILGFSVGSLIASVTYTIEAFLSPSGRHVWAFGNVASCQALGFLTQLSLMAFWYNGLLSCLFLGIALSQIKQKNYVDTFEPWMHLTSSFFPVTAITGLRSGWYGEDSSSCWVADVRIAWYISGIPLMLVFFSIIINYAAIYGIVRKSLLSSETRIKKEATISMFLYVAGFIVSFSPYAVLNIMEINYGYSRSDSNVYPLYVLVAITLPLQGFLNILIYIKPFYTQFRAVNPNKPVHFVLYQALFNPKAPRLNHRRVANHVTHGESVLITDITLGEDRAMNPNEALFYPGIRPSNQPGSHETNANG